MTCLRPRNAFRFAERVAFLIAVGRKREVSLNRYASVDLKLLFARLYALDVSMEYMMTTPSRALKHDIRFLVHAPSASPKPPSKLQCLLQLSSPVSARTLSPIVQMPPLPVPASVPSDSQHYDDVHLSARRQVVSCSECTFSTARRRRWARTPAARIRISRTRAVFAVAVSARRVT